jgi:hypothetical protein
VLQHMSTFFKQSAFCELLQRRRVFVARSRHKNFVERNRSVSLWNFKSACVSWEGDSCVD